MFFHKKQKHLTKPKNPLANKESLLLYTSCVSTTQKTTTEPPFYQSGTLFVGWGARAYFLLNAQTTPNPQ